MRRDDRDALSRTEQRYRELEGRREVPFAVRVRRGQVGLLVALLLSVLLASVTAAVDLRRLQTPRGAAQAWTEATVFGDCGRHLALSEPAVGDDERDRLCAALAERAARTQAVGTRVRTRLGLLDEGRAVVQAVVESPSGTVEARLRLVRRGDDWRVLRDDLACRVGCAPAP